jgi:hypothetical protein
MSPLCSQLLLRHNADPNKVNGNRETAVDAAVGKPAIVELLESMCCAV